MTVTAKAKTARSGLAPGFSPVSRGAAPARVTPGRPLGKSAAPAKRGRGDQGPAVLPSNSSSGPPQPSSRRRGITPLTPMRVQAAKSMTKLADSMKQSHPDMLAHQHVRDAARMLRAGNEEAAQRHLRAAMFAMTPQSLMRNGLHTDDHHIAARDAMHGIHRHLLLVKDVADVAAKNQAAIRRDSYDDDSSSPPPVTSPVRSDPNAGYGPGALAQKPTARQPPGNQALNAPARSSSGGSDPAVADPVGTQPRGSKQFTTRNGVRTVTELAYGWGDLATLIERDPVELSAETGRLAATPAPRGKPGGPGLYGVKSNMHSPYMQQIVKALIEKRGMDPGKAYAIAWGAMRKWSRGGGKVTPEVAAAAAGGLGLEKAAEARAHAHAASWDDVDRAINLAAAPAPAPAAAPASSQQGGALPARVAAGSAAGGQFSAGGGGQPSQGKTAATGKAGAKPPLTAHQQHIAHVAHLLKVSTAKAALLVTAQDDRAKASALIKQRDALVKALASAGGKTSTGQSGSTTSANSTTSSTAPAAAAPATAAAPASTSTASTTTAAKAPAAAATAAPSASAPATSAAGLKTQIAALNTQISALLAQANQATAQAAKMK